MKQSLIFLFLLAAPLSADPPKLEIPAEMKPVNGYFNYTPTSADTVSIIYICLETPALYPVPSNVLKDPRTFLLPVSGVSAGRYRFTAVGASKTGEQAQADFVAIVGVPPPIPPPPGPGPNPPGPNPPDPFGGQAGAAGTFRALIVYDSSKKLSDEQQSILVANAPGTTRAYARDHANKGADGYPEFRVFPDGTPVADEAALWKKVMSRSRATLPWIVLGNGKTGFEGPLPATQADTVALMKKYAEGQ